MLVWSFGSECSTGGPAGASGAEWASCSDTGARSFVTTLIPYRLTRPANLPGLDTSNLDEELPRGAG